MKVWPRFTLCTTHTPLALLCGQQSSSGCSKTGDAVAPHDERGILPQPSCSFLFNPSTLPFAENATSHAPRRRLPPDCTSRHHVRDTLMFDRRGYPLRGCRIGSLRVEADRRRVARWREVDDGHPLCGGGVGDLRVKANCR